MYPNLAEKNSTLRFFNTRAVFLPNSSRTAGTSPNPRKNRSNGSKWVGAFLSIRTPSFSSVATSTLRRGTSVSNRGLLAGGEEAVPASSASTPCHRFQGLTGAHSVVLRVVLDFGEGQLLQDRGQIHAEPPAVSLAETVPTSDRILRRTAPLFDRSRG